MQIIFAALAVEITVTLSVDMRIFSVPFTDVVVISTLSPSSICGPLGYHVQVKLLATAVQLNSATPLTETLTACGGMVISACR